MPSLKLKTRFTVSHKIKTGLWLLIIVSTMIVFTESYETLKYGKYLIFPVLLGLNIAQDRPVFRLKNVDHNFITYTFLWLAACVFSLIVGLIFDEPGDIVAVRYLKEFYFTNTALFSVLLLFNISSTKSIKKAIDYFMVASFIYVFIIQYHKILDLFSYHSSIYYFITPPTESYLTAIYGAAFLLYFKDKNWKMAIPSLLTTIVGSKRIVIAAVFGTLMLYYALKPLRKTIVANKLLVTCLALLCNLIYALFIYKLTQGNFDDTIYNLTGVPPNWLFTGRVAMYKDVFHYVGSFPWLPKGLGFIGSVLEYKHIHSNAFFIHMHSDVLKYIIEFGLPIFLVVMGFMYRMSLRNYHAFILLVYFNIYMLTDNPSILYEFYIFYFIIFMLMLKDNSPVYPAKKPAETQLNTIPASP